MKHIALVLLVLTPLIGGSQNIEPKKKIHSTINVTGRDLSNDRGGGSVSYSIGQVFVATHQSSEDYALEGVQQPLVSSVFSLEKIKNKFQISVYPNPATNFFEISLLNYAEGSLKYHLMDLHSRMLKEGRIERSGTRVNIGNLPAALYLLKLSSHGKFIKTIKIIKK